MGLDRSLALLITADRFESHEARDLKLLESTTPLDAEHKVGWPIVALTIAFAILVVGMLAYLTICPGPPAR
jgi:hypothetical protein